jgi:DNA polymerase-3 subunit gamma/tau
MPSRDQLVEAWGDHVLGRLRPKAKALFQAGRFVGVDGDKAKFGLPNETHRMRCEEVRGDVEGVLSEHFGRRVALVLVVDDSSGEQGPPAGRSGAAGPDSFAPSPGPGGPVGGSASARGSAGGGSAGGSSAAAAPSAAGSAAGGSSAAAGGSSEPSASARRPSANPSGTPPVSRVSESASPAVSAPSDRSAPIEDDDDQDFSAFDESELGEVANVDNSPEARVLQAFPGAEEVN